MKNKKAMALSLPKGFTLIELLVVISIIAILLATGVVSYQRATRLSRDAKRKTDLEQIRQALETYRAENGYYFRGTKDGYFTIEAEFQNGIVPNYITNVPLDPKNSSGYYYLYVVPGAKPTTYSLYAILENPNDPAVDGNISYWCGPTSSTICNYKVTNP